MRSISRSPLKRYQKNERRSKWAIPLLLTFMIFSVLTVLSPPAFAVSLTVVLNPNEVTGSARFTVTYKDKNDIVTLGPNESGTTLDLNANSNYNISYSQVNDYREPATETIRLGKEDFTHNVSYEYLGGGEDIDVPDVTTWPIWPRTIINADVWEPYSFTSIGRDVVSWVTFDQLESNPGFFVSDFRVIVRTGELQYQRVSPNFSYSQDYWYDAGTTRKDYPSDLSGMIADLRSFSVFPTYVSGWMTQTIDEIPTTYPNQDFGSWLGFSEWMDFLRGEGATGFRLEDSGHAPPLTMWAEDNWLTFFVDKNSVPSAWLNNDGTEKVFIYLPTNQGILNCFKVSDDPAYPGATRVWSLTPFPAFKQAIYNQIYFVNSGESRYSRLTILDGPVYLHDVQDSNGAWKRILVGSTGLGTEQVNKIGPNWVKEGAPSPTDSPAISSDSPSRIFGIYAIDVTNPMNPIPLWSVTNINCDRSLDASVNRLDIAVQGVNDPDRAKYSAYQDVDFMTSRPLIGFTETPERVRTWHLLFVALGRDKRYRWINADPMTGEVITSGTFNGFNGEIVEAMPSEETYGYNFEDWYPSRILAAYPGEGGLPVLSDVYIYLSNGTFYFWDLNRYDWRNVDSSAPVPQKIFNVYTNTAKQYPAPPLTDFDIAYIGGDTFLAATAPLDYPGWGSPHDTYGLLIVNLTRIQQDGTIDLNTQGAVGLGGDTKLRLMEDGVAMVQLQTGTGGGTKSYNFEELAASPMFANYYLYQAIYSSEATLSRLYTLDMGYVAGLTRGSGGRNPGLPDDAYFDDPDNAFAAMFIDSEGNLVILDADGNVVQVIEGVLDFSNMGTGTGSTGSTGVRTVYWKTM